MSSSFRNVIGTRAPSHMRRADRPRKHLSAPRKGKRISRPLAERVSDAVSRRRMCLPCVSPFTPCGSLRSKCSRRASDKEDHTDADRSVLLVHDCLRSVCLTQYHAAVRAARLSPVRSGGWAGADRWSAARRLTKYAAARPLFALRAGRMAASGITRRGALRRRRLLCARADGSLPKWWDPAGGNDFGGNPTGGGKLYSPCPTG